jgi:hypothetical protein
MTPEQREQLFWLLDDNYNMVTDRHRGRTRQLSQETVQALVDRAPLTAEEALERGLVDDLAYEDELPYLLAPVEQEHARSGRTPGAGDRPHQAAEDGEPAGVEGPPMARSDHVRACLAGSELLPLTGKARLPLPRYVGVVSLEGMIVTGESQQPPVDLPIPL